MKIINLPRGCGKTTRLLYASEFNDSPILCMSQAAKQHLLDSAKRLKLKIPEPITPSDVTMGSVFKTSIRDKDILVDEAPMVLQSLLSFIVMICDIKAITLTDEENTKMIECELLTKMQNNLEEELLLWKQDFEECKENFKNEFQTEWSKKKFKWFFKKYRQRKLKSKIYRRHRIQIFELVEDVLDDALPKAIWPSFDQLTDVNDIALGDKNYFVDEKLIDKFNSYGCTSFNLNSEQLAEMIDDDKQEPQFPKCPQCGQYLKLIAGNPAETYWICESCGKKYILNVFTEKLNEFKEESTND